jgi:hypothetical protein
MGEDRKPPEGKYVAVYPNYALGSAAIKNQSPAIATGWAVRFKRRGGAFPLSSHADFPQLLSFIKNSKPKRVFTCFGSSLDLANILQRKLGLEARPLPTTKESKLTDFNL